MGIDLFGNKRARLKKELRALREQQETTSARAAERQDKIAELERIIDDLKAELHARQRQGATASAVDEAQQALRDAQAIHSEATR